MTPDLDVAIIGGGIAGLWLLARLRALGYGVLLVEQECLGAGQTIRSQGIIHGGVKYALQGKLSGASRAIAAMPEVWRQCLAGNGEVDLSQVRIASQHQYLWTSDSVASRLTGFFASHAMRSRMQAVSDQDRPELLADLGFRGQVYRLDEPVLDSASLLQAFASQYREATVCGSVRVQADGCLRLGSSDQEALSLRARRIVLTAGVGNAILNPQAAMQRRPLHMVMARGLGATLYGHYLGHTDKPRLTVTTHWDSAGRMVWYLGGQLAETGVERDSQQQIAEARSELSRIFPGLDLSKVQFATLRVDRAEACQSSGVRPDRPSVLQKSALMTAWPTKLAMAPILADVVLEHLEQDKIWPHCRDFQLADTWPRPQVAAYPWNEVETWC